MNGAVRTRAIASVSAALLAATASPLAAAGGWSTSVDATFYAYGAALRPASDSVLNPDNRIARLSRETGTVEGRFNLRIENGPLRLSARPIVHWLHDNAGEASDAYLAQWQLRLRLGQSASVALGREMLTWGPAQFRSPSSPYYFDNGRSNPIRELSGVDVGRLIWAPDARRSLYLAYLSGSGHDAPRADPWADSWLLKADLRGDDFAVGALIASRPHARPFWGAHAQFTASDAWLLYGEIGVASRAGALRAPSDPVRPFVPLRESARRADWLAGASYTLENGHSVIAEYLRHGHGYDGAQQRAYFRRADMAWPPDSAADGATLAQALGGAQSLLGRDYLHLIWQNNPMSEEGHRRLMLTRNLDDRSMQVSLFAEHPLNHRMTAFLLALLPIGARGTEFGDLLDYHLTIGARIVLP